MKKRARLLLAIVLAIAVALLGLVFIRKLIDFPVYYRAGRSLIEGRTDLYAVDFALGRVMDYRYPSFFLIALYPLWLLPYGVAAYLWYLFSVSQIAASVTALNRVVAPYRPSKTVWIVSGFAVAEYFVMILHYGNAHLLAVSLLFVSFYLAGRRKTVWAALLMALSITIKLTPVLLLPYFALKKQWKFLGLVGAFLVAVNLVPAAYFGFGQNARLLGQWYEKVIAEQEFHETNGPINLSLKGQLRRCFTDVDYAERVDGDTRYPAVNVASFTFEQTDRVWIAVSACLYLFVLALIWRRSRFSGDRTGDSVRLDPVEFGLMICLMLFVGPLTSKIYFIALLWPVVYLAVFAFKGSAAEARWGKLVLTVVLVANVVLPLLPGRSTQRLLLVLGVDFYLNALLFASLIYLARSRSWALQASGGELQTQALPSTRTP